MQFIITVTEVDKSISNNTLSSWTAAGDVPTGWDSLGVKAVEGGNFGYLCQFNSFSIDWTSSYLKHNISDISGSNEFHIHLTGRVVVLFYDSSDVLIDSASMITDENVYGLLSYILNLTGIEYFKIAPYDAGTLNETYVDFVSVLPENFPAGSTQSFINTKNILNIDTLSRYIENDLFSFVSDSITLSIFDDGNSSYTIINDMLQSGKLFRLNVGYNNGVKWYYLILFCDPSTISKTIENGRSIYTIEAFELASYFKVNGWFLGNLVSEYEDVTGEVTGQTYYYFVSGNKTISEIIDDGIVEAKKFLIAEYVPIKDISSIVTTYQNTISSFFGLSGRIIDYYYNPVAKTSYILVYGEGNQVIYEIKYSGLLLIGTFTYNITLKFKESFAGSNDTMFKLLVINGAGGSFNNSIHEINPLSGDSYSVYESDGTVDQTGIYLFTVTWSAVFTSSIIVNNYVETWIPDIADGVISNDPERSYSFNISTDIIRVKLTNLSGDIIYNNLINGSEVINSQSEISYTTPLLSTEISNYRLENKTLIDMLKDLSVIQNAFFYFNYEISSSNMQIVFQTRAYETATSQLTIDLNNASKYEETHDYIDYSDFETETFKDIVSMKRSLLAYFRNFYGNGLKIIKLTMNELLDISLGDIVTVEGNKYIIRSLETEIGYKDMTGMIQTPKMYLELMEVLLA